MIWNELKLSEIATEFINGGTPSTKVPKYWDGDIPWITGADVTDRVVVDSRKRITEEAVANSSTHVVPKNAVLLVTRTGVGKLAKAGCDIAISQDLTGIVLKRKIDPDYVIYAIQSRMDSLARFQQGAIIKGLLRKDVENLKVPLPPLSEQRRIVEILDQANELQKKRVEADRLSDRILQAFFYNTFGDPIFNSKKLEITRLGELIEEPQFGISVALSEKTEKKDGYLPVLRIANVTNEGYLTVKDLRYESVSEKMASKLSLRQGDLLFNWRNSPNLVGKTAVFDQEGDFIFASFLFRIRTIPTRANNFFVWFFLNELRRKGWFESKCRQAVSQANFGRDELAAIEVPAPLIEDQKKFAAQVTEFNRLRQARSESKIKLEEMFSTLLYRAFSGDLMAKWREAHMKELLQEMEEQARELGGQRV